MNLDHIPEEIFDWLSQKSFEELNTQEKNTVLEWMSPKEYQEMRSSIQDFSQEDHILEQQWQQPSTLQAPQNGIKKALKIIHSPIPAYQVAASILIILGLFFFLQERRDNNRPIDTIQVKKKGKSIKNDQYPDSLVFNL